MTETNDYDPALLASERTIRAMRSRYRARIVEALGEPAAQRYDRAMRDVDLGIAHAIGVWRGMSAIQRVTALRMLTARCLVPLDHQFVMVSRSGRETGDIVGRSTVDALLNRGLIYLDENGARLSERGRFMLRFRRGR